MPPTLRLVLLVVSFAPACSCGEDIHLGDRDAAADGGRFTRTDECGNGLDDDGNGAIDDGCPCAPGETQRCFSGALAENEVGACRSGMQTCQVATGSEWGDWGESACESEILPGAEACDGTDADCDGAIDEGCPCTEGMTRGCGDEFILAPCRPGTQSCRGGTWSACEGAIGPTADVCEDAIDNDCDGLTNEGCECPYPPVPEVCRDAIDNDCDGTTDEPECTPDWPGDAGVPTYDAGMCDPTLGTPRLLAPLSTSRVTSRRPEVRWELPSGAAMASLELCADPSCATVIERLEGTSAAQPTRALPIGPVFFRARAMSAGRVACDTSHTWEMFVTATDSAIDTAQGHVLDVNRDGHPDLVLAEPFMAADIRLHLGRDGGFETTGTVIAGPPSVGRYDVELAGDVNGDGYSDLVVRFYGASPNTCTILRGGPSGLEPFTSGVTLTPCGAARELGDYDGDGYGDLAITRDRDPVLAFGSASLAFTEVAYSGTFPRGLFYANLGRRAGDVNGDGLADLVVEVIYKNHSVAGDPWSVYPFVFHGNAARTWLAGPSLTRIGPSGMIQPQEALGDFDGDGYGDYAVLSLGDPFNAHVLFGGSTGLTDASRVSTVLDGSVFHAIRLGDLDGDGDDDADFAGRIYAGEHTAMSPFASSPTWTFNCTNAGACSGVGVGDVNDDGWDDVFRADGATGRGMLLRGSITGPTAETDSGISVPVSTNSTVAFCLSD